MEPDQFNNINKAIGKFVSSCTDATGQHNAVMYFKQRFN